MADVTQENALKAMRKAYEAGDTAAAKRMAALAKSLEGQSTRGGIMGQVNEGIAATAGGLVDFLNPFDNPVWGEVVGGKLQTGSAAEGLRTGMRAIGADVATDTPDGMVEGFARGVGNAAGAILPAAKAAQLLTRAGGVVGGVATDAYAALASRGGAIAELGAGGAGTAAREAAEGSGAPEWVQDTVEIAVPAAAIPAIAAAVRGSVGLAAKMPLAAAGLRIGKDVVRGLAPMTDAGAREVAKARVQGLVGGEDRAAEIGRAISPNDPLNRTPAQQSGDPNLMGLERAAESESPLVRERLDLRATASRKAATDEIAGMGGKVKDAKTFFENRLKTFRSDMQARVDRMMKMAVESVEGVGPRSAETANSTAMVARVKGELDTQLQREGELWRAVPVDARIETRQTAGTVDTLIKETPWAQRRDIPADLQAAFGPNGPIGEATTVGELYGLYSEMRRVARSAMAGNDQNKNRARIANEVAEAILADLGAIGGESPAGRAINEARVFSRALHETFDQGAVGRILKRTLDGDEALSPETALARTVGRGGAQGLTDATKIETAAPKAGEEITDYLRGRFTDSIFGADGSFSPKRAEDWLRSNRELMARYPRVLTEFRRALNSRTAAEAFAVRADARMKLADAKSSPAEFNLGQDQKAVLSILGADNPAISARSIVATARKDATGKALAGVKGAFSDYLIGNAGSPDGLSGPKLTALINDLNTSAALQQVYTPEEFGRLRRIATDLAKMETKGATVGDVMDSPANRLVEYVVRIAAARSGGQMGGGTIGGSMQTANIVTERARAMLRNLTNDKARQLLMDAIEEPALFKALLMEPRAIELNPTVRNKVAPYLTGAAGAGLTDDRQEAR